MKIRRTSTVSGMGRGHVRVPIPQDIAKHLALQPGDVLLWTLQDGQGLKLERADERS